MSYTRKEWAGSLLAAIGNTSPDPYITGYVIAWTQFETGGPPGAAYNLLNTTEQNTPGVAGYFNCLKRDNQGNCIEGVIDYDSFEHGIEANAKVLRNGDYPELAVALEHNNDIALKAPDQGIMHELGLWGTGRASDIANLAGRPDSLLSEQAFLGTGPVGGPPVVPPAPVEAPSKVVKIGKGEDFKLVQETINGEVRFVVVLKHSSEDKLKKAGYF